MSEHTEILIPDIETRKSGIAPNFVATRGQMAFIFGYDHCYNSGPRCEQPPLRDLYSPTFIPSNGARTAAER